MTTVGLMRLIEPALSSGPHSVGAHFSVSGLSFTWALATLTPARQSATTSARTTVWKTVFM